jgi:hypothetical protein
MNDELHGVSRLLSENAFEYPVYISFEIDFFIQFTCQLLFCFSDRSAKRRIRDFPNSG